MNWTASNVIEHRGTFLTNVDGGIFLLQQFNMQFKLTSATDVNPVISCDANVIAYSLNFAKAEPTGIAIDILRPVADQFEEIKKGTAT